MEQTTGNRPSGLDCDPIPWPSEHAFSLWQDLHQGRTNGGFGPCPLSWLDFDAWSHMRGVKPTYSELELIRVIDHAYLTATAEKKES